MDPLNFSGSTIFADVVHAGGRPRVALVSYSFVPCYATSCWWYSMQLFPCSIMSSWSQIISAQFSSGDVFCKDEAGSDGVESMCKNSLKNHRQNISKHMAKAKPGNRHNNRKYQRRSPRCKQIQNKTWDKRTLDHTWKANKVCNDKQLGKAANVAILQDVQKCEICLYVPQHWKRHGAPELLIFGWWFPLAVWRRNCRWNH